MGLVTDILQKVLPYKGGNDSCVTVALLSIVWKTLTLNYETEREEDSRYRNNKHDFNCESGNHSFVTVAVFVF